MARVFGVLVGRRGPRASMARCDVARGHAWCGARAEKARAWLGGDRRKRRRVFDRVESESNTWRTMNSIWLEKERKGRKGKEE